MMMCDGNLLYCTRSCSTVEELGPQVMASSVQS